jgi:hypothetical protein
MGVQEERNGDHRARLVAQGISHVPGVDFSENFAPVIDDTSFRIVLSLIQKWGASPLLWMLRQPFCMEVWKRRYT